MSVFVVLGIIWAAVLVPPLLRARSERRAEFIDSFQEQMGALGGKARAVNLAGARRAEPESTGTRLYQRVSPAKRRRDILGGLLGAMIGAFLLGAIPSLRIVWALALFLVNAFLGYLTLLAFQRKNAADRRRSRGRVASSAQPTPPPARLPQTLEVRPARAASGR